MNAQPIMAAGRWAVLRNGAAVGPIEVNTASWEKTHPWRDMILGYTWTDSGAWNDKGKPGDPIDVIATFPTRAEAEAYARGEPVPTPDATPAIDWPHGATEIRFGPDNLAIDTERGLVGLNDWTLSFHPDEARRVGRAMIAAADALAAAMKGETK